MKVNKYEWLVVSTIIYSVLHKKESPMNHIWDQQKLSEEIEKLKKQGATIVFTNGCFDIIHAGHVRYLNEARSKGDYLIVGLNSDQSVMQIKGPKRPIVPQEQRAEVLAALSCVSFVTVFDEPDPFKLINRLKPHVLVKGADWEEKNIIGADIVKSEGGRVERIHVVEGISTSQIIQRIIKLYI